MRADSVHLILTPHPLHLHAFSFTLTKLHEVTVAAFSRAAVQLRYSCSQPHSACSRHQQQGSEVLV